MAKTYGIDVSHWEGHIDWQEASQHVEFCIFKATDGLYFVDPEFLANKLGCVTYKVPWGVYHFYQPAFDPEEQAEHFISVVGPDAPVYVADVEYDLPGDVDWSPLLKLFLDRVHQLTGKMCMIYTSPYKWESFFPTPAWTDDYDLWVAHWEVQAPILPNGWTSYIIHQVGDSGSIPGIPGAVDEDWFNGDLNDVWDYFSVEIPPPPGDIRIRVVPGYRRAAPIFKEADGDSTILGYALHQSSWYATERVAGTDGDYYRINRTGYIQARMCNEL